jgi:hypothetical protein
MMLIFKLVDISDLIDSVFRCFLQPSEIRNAATVLPGSDA